MSSKPTPQEVYRGVLNPACDLTLTASSRKKMINGNYPTKALVKKAAASKNCQIQESKKESPKKKAPSPKKRSTPIQFTPVPPRKLDLPVLPRITENQKKTAAMMENLFARVQNKDKYDKPARNGRK